MFTLEQIKTAHAKVKSGADFPSYIKELITLGLTQYTQFVSDGHTVYWGANNYSIQSDAKYPAFTISNEADKEKLKIDLKIHQQGGTNYLTFCEQAAEAGVETWTVNMGKMTCTYYDKNGNEMLAEAIPE
ncbi:DUF1398 domain-containing protein [Cytophaga aurantiaca]|uniref:DUF1398 domain-containing protein n=1 Tax=Cytophaga aurantiaca TaxID=29530 RepID=UPI0003672F42|nr:DUF1398 family protein [Cytophaga aurantiaca]